MAGQAPQLGKARFHTGTLRDLEGLTSCFSLQGGDWPRINLRGEVLLQHPKEVCCNELVYSAELEKIQMWPPTLRPKTFTPMSVRQTGQPKSVYFHYSPVQWQQHLHIKLTFARHANATSEFLRIQSEVAVSVWMYVTLVKCHVQTAASLISVSHFHALLMEAGITRKSVSAACAYMFLWSHPLPLDKAEKKRQIFASIFGLCEIVHVQKDKMINIQVEVLMADMKIRTTRKAKNKFISFLKENLFYFECCRVFNNAVVLKPKLKENALWFLEPADVTFDTWSWLLTTPNPV